MVDLTKLIIDTDYNAFKQNNIYTGKNTITGTVASGLNTRTFAVSLAKTPDMLDILFNGPTDTVHGLDPRPGTAWFRQGYIWVPTNNAGGGNPSPWIVSSSLTDSNIITITLQYVQTFTTGETLTNTDFYYRVIDYSVF